MGSIFLLKSVLIILFVGLPLFGILQCALDYEMPGSTKVIWIVLMMFTGALGALLFAFMGTRSASFRVFALSGVVGLLIAVPAVMRGGFKIVENTAASHVEDIYGKWGDTYMQDISVEQHNRIFGAVDVLEQETQETKSSVVSQCLLEALSVLIDDGDLTLSEYQTWNQQYSQRDRLSPIQAREFVTSIR